MEEIKSKISGGNYFDTPTVAHIDAYYREGVFYDADTNKPIKLDYNENRYEKGILVKIIVPLKYISDENIETHGNRIQKKILDKGSILNFCMIYQDEMNEKYDFQLLLEQDLFLNKVGNKLAKLNSCKCTVTLQEEHKNKTVFKDFKPIECKSLNQAFLQTSIKYRPTNSSHVCNVFTTFKMENGKLLNSFR